MNINTIITKDIAKNFNLEISKSNIRDSVHTKISLDRSNRSLHYGTDSHIIVSTITGESTYFLVDKDHIRDFIMALILIENELQGELKWTQQSLIYL